MASSVIEMVSKWSGAHRNVNGKLGLLNITPEVVVKNALTYSPYAYSNIKGKVFDFIDFIDFRSLGGGDSGRG
jgi:hypothetical protein